LIAFGSGLVLVSLPLVGLVRGIFVRDSLLGTREIGFALFCAAATCALMILVALYLRRYQPQVYDQNRYLLLIALVAVFAAVNIRAAGAPLGITLSPYQQGLVAVIFVSMAGMVLAILLGQQLATVAAGALAVYASFLMDGGIGYVFIAPAFISAAVGIIAASDMSDRRGLIRAGVAIAVTDIVFAVILGLAFAQGATGTFVGVAWSGGGAFVAVGAVWVAIAVLERPFGIATHVTLIELANPMGRILQQLQNDAPGTFMHSVHVANLAERAAESIGADSLLARVGSQYHDIGKMKRPRFFYENLVYYGENQHDKLSPTLSALVVRAHVKDGLEMARQHKLPAVIRDFIAQHHGTSLVTFFYHRAVESGAGALESQFRYEGPIPQSREAAIVMLADTIEAAARSERVPTKDRLVDLVERLVAERSADGQLAASGLSSLDLDQVKSSFVRTLAGLHHARVEYPDLSEVLEEEGTPDASERDLAQAGAGGGAPDQGAGGVGPAGGGRAPEGPSDGRDDGRAGDSRSQLALLPEEAADKRACVSE
jgi:putative nucleotidyltransferase with HDIG domain